MVWEAVARQVRPLKGRAAPRTATPPVRPPELAPPAPVPGEPAGRQKALPAVQPMAPLTRAGGPGRTLPGLRPAVEIGQRQPGLDDTSWRGLASGRLRPQRTLDLHGRTADHAFRALHGFLLRARTERLRCVEIVTGVGSGAEGGILRRELPGWLNRPDLRGLVLAAVHPHPGNAGSVRVLLRRRAGRGDAGSG